MWDSWVKYCIGALKGVIERVYNNLYYNLKTKHYVCLGNTIIPHQPDSYNWISFIKYVKILYILGLTLYPSYGYLFL